MKSGFTSVKLLLISLANVSITLRCLINGGAGGEGGQNKRGGGRKSFQNLINGGGRKLKKRLKMLIKRWKEQK